MMKFNFQKLWLATASIVVVFWIASALISWKWALPICLAVVLILISFIVVGRRKKTKAFYRSIQVVTREFSDEERGSLAPTFNRTLVLGDSVKFFCLSFEGKDAWIFYKPGIFSFSIAKEFLVDKKVRSSDGKLFKLNANGVCADVYIRHKPSVSEPR